MLVLRLKCVIFGVVFCGFEFSLSAQPVAVGAKVPGVRGGAPGPGQPLGGPSAGELAFFARGEASFLEVDTVTGAASAEPGLGPTFNMDSCGGCHAQPATGGTS